MTDHDDDDQPRRPYPHGSPHTCTTPPRPESTALDDHERELGRSGVAQCRQTLSRHPTGHPGVGYQRATQTSQDR